MQLGYGMLDVGVSKFRCYTLTLSETLIESIVKNQHIRARLANDWISTNISSFVLYFRTKS
jgi:hypothetical protein